MDEFYGGNVYKYSIEPTSDKGLHRYVDLMSLLPQHIRNRPDLAKIIYLFQDYLNDGYRKIPEPSITQSYKSTLGDKCRSPDGLTSYLEISRPLNHTTSMYKRRLSSGLDYSNYGNDPIEEYYKERDIDTWAIEDNVMDEYKSSNGNQLFGNSGGLYSYYNEPKQYYSSSQYYAKMNNLANTYPSQSDLFVNTSMYFSSNKRVPNSNLDEYSMTLDEMRTIIPVVGDLPKIVFTYYACNAEAFLSDFALFTGYTNLKFKVESRKMPYFYGISDYIDHNDNPPFANDAYVPFDQLDIDPEYKKSFRVSLTYDERHTGAFLNSNLFEFLPNTPKGDFAFTVYPETLDDVLMFSYPDVPVIASSLLVIYKYQHPEVFYSTFSYQNAYRHEKKGASVAEKIYRLAYSKDPSVFDYEYLALISQHFGYSIETDEQEINQNSYYKTKEEKEQVIRNLIKNMPEYNRMKGTDSGIEMVLLSFGLVGRIVTLFTRGDSKVPGYVDFIDGRLVSGDIEEFIEAEGVEVDNDYDEVVESRKMSEQFRSDAQLGDTSIYDWYASPHFRIEFDILKDYLNIARSSEQFSTIAKTIKRIKPINTVFQGFYAKLSAEFGSLFINPPVCMNKGKMILNVDTRCIFEDNWTEQCALELTHDS